MPATPHRPRKRFGQHFLHDRNVIQRIIEALEPAAGSRVIEIGPGRGALTGPLLEVLPTLEVVEIDRDLADILEQSFGDSGRLTVHRGNVLKFDFCAGGATPVRVVGNLPYNISTPLLFHLLDQQDCIEVMLVMLQKEVARRICAGPGSRDYGRLSVMIQASCAVETLFDVGRDAFTPAPRVDSAVIRLRPHAGDGPDIGDRRQFARLVRTAFSRHRKTLRNGLKGLLDTDDFEAAGIDPETRPETLPVEAFARLAARRRG